MNALFDTNILIDYLQAVPQARQEIEFYAARYISIVTWMEVMIGADAVVEAATSEFLAGFKVIALDDPVARCAVRLRRAHRIKLPEAIIWASAQCHALLLVTRNIRDFPPDHPGVRNPYKI